MPLNFDEFDETKKFMDELQRWVVARTEEIDPRKASFCLLFYGAFLVDLHMIDKSNFYDFVMDAIETGREFAKKEPLYD